MREKPISRAESKRRSVLHKLSALKVTTSKDGKRHGTMEPPTLKELLVIAANAGMKTNNKTTQEEALTYLVAARNVSRRISRLGIREGVEVTAEDVEAAGAEDEVEAEEEEAPEGNE